MRFLESVDSTNEEIKRIVSRSPGEYAVTSDCQSAGRGRGENAWYSPGVTNLYFSLSLDMGEMIEKDIYPVTAAIGVALHRSLSRFTTGELTLKWPNDLYIRGRKVAGILCEVIRTQAERTFIISGIGLNVNTNTFPPELAERATSLFLEEKKLFNREEILASLLNGIETVIDEFLEKGMETLLPEYRKRCTLWGRRVMIDAAEGIMQDISPRGGLLLKEDSGNVREFFAGTVELIERLNG